MQILSEPTTVRLFEGSAPIKVRGAMCNACNSIVYSRCASDRRTCICGSVALAGGVVPTEMTCSLPLNIQWVNMALDRDLNDLYYDWSLQIDKYGIVYPLGHRKRVTSMKYIISMWLDNDVVFYEKEVKVLRQDQLLSITENGPPRAAGVCLN